MIPFHFLSYTQLSIIYLKHVDLPSINTDECIDSQVLPHLKFVSANKLNTMTMIHLVANIIICIIQKNQLKMPLMYENILHLMYGFWRRKL